MANGKFRFGQGAEGGIGFYFAQFSNVARAQVRNAIRKRKRFVNIFVLPFAQSALGLYAVINALPLLFGKFQEMINGDAFIEMRKMVAHVNEMAHHPSPFAQPLKLL